MGATATLFSLNGLAVELGVDRRTVASALRTTVPDGKLASRPAWFLSTALKALNNRHIARHADDNSPGLVELAIERLSEQPDEEPPVLTVAEFGAVIDADDAAVRTWCAAGMPHHRVDGEIRIVPAPCWLWIATMLARATPQQVKILRLEMF